MSQAPCYAQEDGLAGCMEDCFTNLAICPEEMAEVNRCVLEMARISCDWDPGGEWGSLVASGCDEELLAQYDCSGHSAY